MDSLVYGLRPKEEQITESFALQALAMAEDGGSLYRDLEAGLSKRITKVQAITA